MSIPVLAAATNETILVAVLLQLAVIIGVARLFGRLARFVRQPAVVGEIVAGVVLGPSVFGKIEILLGHPDHPWSSAIFRPEIAPTFNVLSQIGLILMMFIVGLEFDFAHLKSSSGAVLSIALAGAALPFALGCLLGWGVHGFMEPIERPDGSHTLPLFHGFVLFMGTAMCITALPVLARMLIDFGIARTRLAAIAIGAAAVEDALGWILLAAVSAMVRAEFQIAATLRMIGLTLLFAAAMIFLVRPLLVRWVRWSLARTQGEMGPLMLGLLLLIVFGSAIVTSLIGIFAVFGAFLVGGVLSGEQAFRQAAAEQLRNFVTVFFMPIFFTLTGLRTQVDALASPTLWLLAAAVCATAILGKLVGCTLAARAAGITTRESWCIGAMMNTRGLMELVVINVGYDLGILPRSMFCMLVFMALATTLMTGPLLHMFRKNTEIESLMV